PASLRGPSPGHRYLYSLSFSIDTPPPDTFTLSLHDALPISLPAPRRPHPARLGRRPHQPARGRDGTGPAGRVRGPADPALLRGRPRRTAGALVRAQRRGGLPDLGPAAHRSVVLPGGGPGTADPHHPDRGAAGLLGRPPPRPGGARRAPAPAARHRPGRHPPGLARRSAARPVPP